jgi:hypothetical protein
MLEGMKGVHGEGTYLPQALWSFGETVSEENRNQNQADGIGECQHASHDFLKIL